MKKIYSLLLGLVLCAINPLYAQNVNWVRSTYGDCLYHTNEKFTWSGDCNSGYCDGFGTITWVDGSKYIGNLSMGMNSGFGTQYYANGQKLYEGQWLNDKKNGFGKLYDADGYLMFKGNFINGEHEDIKLLNNLADIVCPFILDKVFDGGNNLRYQCVGFYPSNADNFRIYIRMLFDGDIVTTNHYAFTLVLKSEAPFIDFVDYNETTQNYLLYKSVKVGAQLYQEISEYLKEHSN